MHGKHYQIEEDINPPGANISKAYHYDVFFSYATDPDYRFVRSLKSFIETFHRVSMPSDIELRPLKACMDGLDFRSSRNIASSSKEAVLQVIESYLAQSESLLVLCSKAARHSEWVKHEVEWFLDKRGENSILLAVTEGVDPVANPEDVFPQPIIDAGLHRHIWYDFRASRGRKAKAWKKVRDYDDNRTRLAADLLGKSTSDVQPFWYREQKKASQRRVRAITMVAVVMTVLLVISTVLAIFAVNMRNLADERRLQALDSLADSKVQEGSALIHAYRWPEGFSSLNEGRKLLTMLDRSILPVGLKMLEAEKRSLVPYVYMTLPVVNYMDVSKDGTKMAVVGEKFVYTIDLELDQQIASFLTGEETVTAFDFSNSGTRVALAKGKHVQVFDAQTGKSLALTPIRSDKGTALRFDPMNESNLIMASTGSIIYWRTADDTQIELMNSDAEVIEIDAAVSEHLFVSASWNNAVNKICEFIENRCRKVQNIDLDEVTGHALSDDGKWFALADGKFLRVYDTQDGKLLAQSQQSTNQVKIFGSVALSTDFEGNVHAFNIQDGTTLGNFPNRPGLSMPAAAFSPARIALLSSAGDRVLYWQLTFDSLKGMSESHLFEDDYFLSTVSLSADGNLIATADSNGFIRVWDAFGLREVQSIPAHKGYIDRIVFAPDSKSMVTLGEDKQVLLWQLENVRKAVLAADPKKQYTAIAFAPDSKSIAIGDSSGSVQIVDPAGKIIAVPIPAGNKISSLAYSPTGTQLAVGREKENLLIWNVGSTVQTAVKTNPVGSQRAFFADVSTVVVSNMTDGFNVQDVQVWNIERKRLINQFEPPTSQLFGAAERLGSDHVLFAGVERLFIYDIHSAKELVNIKTGGALVWGLNAARDGRVFILGSYNGFELFRWSDSLRRAELRETMSSWNLTQRNPPTSRERAATLAEWYFLSGLSKIALGYIKHPEFDPESISALMQARIWLANGNIEEAKAYFKIAATRGNVSETYVSLISRLKSTE